MLHQLPYCGTPPVPGELLTRFNLDPVLLAVLGGLAVGHASWLLARSTGQSRWRDGRHYRGVIGYGLLGWLIAAAAFVSPLCALSVSLFSARVGQHMLLVLVAAPLIALAWPLAHRRGGPRALWLSAAAFFVALWFWHMPVPYDATFRSTPLYWSMHVTLFGTSILLWRELLHHRSSQTIEALTIGALTSMQMGLLGAVLTFAAHPLFLAHLTTTAPWDLSPLRDQQLGGVFMWVPGILLFLFAAVRSLSKLRDSLDGVEQA
jgi:putative membrane protein